MKKVFLIIFLMIISLISFNHVVFSQEEIYKTKVILDLNWGSGADEIGYLDILAGYGGTHAGPTCFDVDKDGNIYILDTVNNYIKIFKQNGDLMQYFSIDDAGREHGYIAVDENNKNIWHHNPWNRTFTEYTFEGSMIKTLKYKKKEVDIIPPQFDIWDGKIMFAGKLEITGLSSEHGIGGEPVYDATIIKWINKTEPSLMNSSKFSKRLYVTLEPELLNNNRLSSPKVLIIDKEGNNQDYIFNEISPLYHVSFLSEDKYENVYFIFTYLEQKRPNQIWKFDNKMNLIGKIDYFPHNYGFNFLMKERLVDDNGNIYFMHLSKSLGVQIIKWYTK